MDLWFRFRFRLRTIKSTVFQKKFGKNLAFLLSKLFYKDKIDEGHLIHCNM
jgi:hypothetical protein